MHAETRIVREGDWSVPLTEEWLELHGFEQDDECRAWRLDGEVFPLFVKRDDIEPDLWAAEIDGTPWPVDIYVRGQVRDLCRALERPLVVDGLAQYRDARDLMVAFTQDTFPAGSRVQPVGTTTGNWGAAVRDCHAHSRRELSADMVRLDWDNGNSFAVKIDDIELITKQRP